MIEWLVVAPIRVATLGHVTRLKIWKRCSAPDSRNILYRAAELTGIRRTSRCIVHHQPVVAVRPRFCPSYTIYTIPECRLRSPLELAAGKYHHSISALSQRRFECVPSCGTPYITTTFSWRIQLPLIVRSQEMVHSPALKIKLSLVVHERGASYRLLLGDSCAKRLALPVRPASLHVLLSKTRTYQRKSGYCIRIPPRDFQKAW